MAVYLFVELDSINSLPDIMNTLIERSIKFTVTKNRHSLCDSCGKLSEVLSTTTAPPIPPVPTPSLSSITSLSHSIFAFREESEESDGVAANEIIEPTAFLECKDEPVSDGDVDDTFVSNTDLLKQVSANFPSISKGTMLEFTEAELSLVKEKSSTGSPKQCQLCGHWITAKNVRAHVATHLTIRRLRCSVCSQGFDRMNRAITHLERMHAGDTNARIESAVNAEQKKEIESLTRKCFPRRLIIPSSFSQSSPHEN